MTSNFGRFSNDPTSQSDVVDSEPTSQSDVVDSEPMPQNDIGDSGSTTAPVGRVGHVVSHDGNLPYQPSAKTYTYKNPILYGFGGVWFPPLVLFLMGGSRKKCVIMLCLWPISFLLIFLLFIGVIPLVGMYIWSMVACYKEAERQNEIHGL